MITSSPILNEYGKRFHREPKAVSPIESRMLRAGFDAATVGDMETSNHWANSDGLSPNSAASSAIRERLRNRSRYEFKNNTYCRGMVSTMANDTVGTGPSLQLLTQDPQVNKDIELEWRKWAHQTDQSRKLRQMRTAKFVDGAAVALTIDNPRLQPVSLDFRLYEVDHLRAPEGMRDGKSHIDGIQLDDNGLPISYWMTNEHPGDESFSWLLKDQGKWYPRGRVFHYKYSDRAGQAHGIPEITPALQLYAILRRYTLAVLGAAESAADVSAIMKTSATSEASADEVDAFLPIDFERRAMITLPFGWDMQQLKAEQPTTTYAEFKHEIINEIARCLNLPYNVASGNSKDYNYASGRLDHQVYHRTIELERDTIKNEILERLFEMWLREFLAFTSGIKPSDIDISQYPHRWVWDAFKYADPQKEAAATVTLWEAGLLPDDEFFLGRGIDPETAYDQLGRMIVRRRKLGLPIPGIAQQEIKVDDEGEQVANSE